MSLEQTDQRPLPLWDLIYLGYTLHKMEGYTEETLLIEDDSPGVIESLKFLLDNLERFELQDSDQLARMILRPLIFRFERLCDIDKNTLGEDTQKLHEALDELLDALGNEASHQYIYPVTPSKHIDVDQLIDDPSSLFELPSLLDPPLPPEFDSQLREAGRCLAVGFGYAAALFTLLATEAILKYYYEIVTGRQPGIRTWAQLNNELKVSKLKCPKLVNEFLENIVENYRNPAMHAELDIDGEMAIDIWKICADAAQQMIKDLLDRGKVTKVDLV